MDKARQAYVRFDFEMERVKFASSKTKQETFISCIQRKYEKLEKFLKFGGKVAALRENSTPRSRHCSLSKHVFQYWKHAQSIYDLLELAWGCQCHDHHHARLYLQHRTSPAFEICLLVLFSPSPSPAHPWKAEDLKIEHVSPHDACGSDSSPAGVWDWACGFFEAKPLNSFQNKVCQYSSWAYIRRADPVKIQRSQENGFHPSTNKRSPNINRNSRSAPTYSNSIEP